MFVEEKRPRQYKDVVGNSVTVNTFKKYTKEGEKFPQVIMLSGQSGTGKSTLGYINAMSLTCESPVKMRGGYFEPCLKCPACQDIITERFSLDVVYKNASAMSKDDVNNLESEAMRGASYGENKVILIEEAQELGSKGAKGALLKLLEKPRKGVYFILLTMDDTAFASALKDRCQIFKFKKHDTKVISDYLMTILEEIDPEEKLPETFIEVVTAIADNADGSIRKALQDFQRCIDGNIYTEEMLIDELEIVTEEKLESLIKGLLEGNALALFEISKKDNLGTLFNKMFSMMIYWKKDYMTNSYFSDAYQKKVEFFALNPNFNKLIETFIEINKININYFNTNNMYFYLLKFVEGVNSKPVSSRRRLKD